MGQGIRGSRNQQAAWQEEISSRICGGGRNRIPAQEGWTHAIKGEDYHSLAVFSRRGWPGYSPRQDVRCSGLASRPAPRPRLASCPTSSLAPSLAPSLASSLASPASRPALLPASPWLAFYGTLACIEHCEAVGRC